MPEGQEKASVTREERTRGGVARDEATQTGRVWALWGLTGSGKEFGFHFGVSGIPMIGFR